SCCEGEDPEMRTTILIKQYGLYYVVTTVVMASCIAALFRRGLPRRCNHLVAGAGILFFVTNNLYLNYQQEGGTDFRTFHRAGEAIRAGGDPYADAAMVSPPPAPLCSASWPAAR